MTVTYPLTPPTSPSPVSVDFRATASVAQTWSPFTQTGDVQVYSGQVQTMRLTLPPMYEAEARAWIAFLMKLNGREGTFLYGDPSMSGPRGTPSGTPVLDSTGSPAGNQVRDRVLVTTGWTANATGLLLAGDPIQLGAGSTASLHTVLTASVDSDAGGNALIDIFPALRRTPTNGEAIVVSAPVGRWRLDGNDMAWSVGAATLYGIEISAREAI